MESIDIKITNARLDFSTNILKYDDTENTGLLDKLRTLVRIEKMIDAQKHTGGYIKRPPKSLIAFITPETYTITYRQDIEVVSHCDWKILDLNECYLQVLFHSRDDGQYDAINIFLHGFVRKPRDYKAERLYTKEIKDMIESL
jgi:hypothetical protein